MLSRSRTVTVLILLRIEIDRDAKRRADLVLPAVALADGARLVVIHHEFLG